MKEKAFCIDKKQQNKYNEITKYYSKTLLDISAGIQKTNGGKRNENKEICENDGYSFSSRFLA